MESSYLRETLIGVSKAFASLTPIIYTRILILLKINVELRLK